MTIKKKSTFQSVITKVNGNLTEFIIKFWIWLVLAMLSTICYFVVCRFDKSDKDNEKFSNSVEQFSKSVDKIIYTVDGMKAEQSTIKEDVNELKKWRLEHEKEASNKEMRLIREIAESKK